jgi:hypothetical protein
MPSKARLKAKNILGIAEGGTGATSMGAGAVGSVTQSASVPTGAIIETGSNANGTYTKYADGTLDCSFKADGSSQAVTSATGSLFQAGSELTWTFPAVFIATPVVTGNIARNDATLVMGLFIRTVATNTVSYRIWSSLSIAAGNVKDVHLIAKGRWF